jgi:endonuclease YncB( thermonuclease family)
MEKVMDKIHNRKIVTVQLKPKNEKYGRLLGTIFYKGENINDWMVNNGYGKSYFGGKKI